MRIRGAGQVCVVHEGDVGRVVGAGGEMELRTSAEAAGWARKRTKRAFLRHPTTSEGRLFETMGSREVEFSQFSGGWAAAILM